MLTSKKKVTYLFIIAQIDEKVNVLNRICAKSVVKFTMCEFFTDYSNKLPTKLRLK